MVKVLTTYSCSSSQEPILCKRNLPPDVSDTLQRPTSNQFITDSIGHRLDINTFKTFFMSLHEKWQRELDGCEVSVTFDL